MLRAITTTVLVVDAAVGLAFGLVEFGCLGTNPPFVAYCGHNVVGALIVLSIALSFILGTLVVSIRAFRNNE